VILGIAASVSLKTTLLIATLTIAGLVVYFFAINKRSLAQVMRIAIPFAIGAAIMPAVIVIYFRALGVWPNLVYCVFQFNELVAKTRTPFQLWWPRIAYIPLMTLALIAIWRRRSATWKFFFTVAFVVFSLTLSAFWILVSPRDLLPIMPLAAVFVASRRFPTIVIACALSVPFLFAYTQGFRNETREYVTMMDQVLRLSRPGEPLMDFKGETVYRRRPYYYILEYISRRQLQAGMIRDTIAEDVLRTRCHVAQADGDFIPPAGRAFLIANFLDMGRLRAAGQMIKPDGTFTIAIPGQYVIVNRFGRATGLLDGTPAQPRELAIGEHHFIGDAERTAVLWAPAFERGFSPFYLQDRDF
jgi:hypothetical protein